MNHHLNGNTIQAVLFDLDGTLLYTLDDIRASLNYALSAHGFREQPAQKVRQLVGRGLGKLVAGALPEERPEVHEHVLATLKQYYKEHPADLSKPYEGIPELLQCLKKQKLSLGIWTNKDHTLANEVSKLRFPGLFEPILGKKDGHQGKPLPDGGLEIARTWGIAPEAILYIGDSEVDVQSAQNCGMPMLAVYWGYRSKHQLEAAGAKHIISHPRQILQQLGIES